MKKENSSKTVEKQGSVTRRGGYRNRVIALILSVVMVICLVPVVGKTEEAHAEEPTTTEEKTVTLGAGVLAEKANKEDAATVWYGYNEANADKDNYKWRVVGFDDRESTTNALSVSGVMTMIAAGNIKTGVEFNKTDNNNSKYNGSNLQREINDNIVSQLKMPERAAIKERLLEENENRSTAYNDGNIIWGSNVNAIMWPLSYKEAKDSLNVNVRILKANDTTDQYCWWLRSPGFRDDIAAFVRGAGNVGNLGLDVFNTFGVRPAFYLNLSSVIFTSLINPATESTGAEYKLTIKDPDIKLSINSYDVSADKTTATVSYALAGANKTNVNKLSVLILPSTYVPGSSATEILYYGELAGSIVKDGIEGTGTFNLPVELRNQTAGVDYYIYLLAEDVNDGKETNYASEPVPVTDFKTVTGLTLGTLDTDAVNTKDTPIINYAGVPWYVVGYDKDHSEDVLSESGAVTLFAKESIAGSDGIEFDTDENRGVTAKNIYEGSVLQKYLDNVYSGSGEQTVKFSTQENEAVKTRTLSGITDNNTSHTYDFDYVRGPARESGQNIKNAGLWPLSVKEAKELYHENHNNSIRAIGISWWLRSPGQTANVAAFVDGVGNVDRTGSLVSRTYGVRPAFYLNLQSIIFASLIKDASGCVGSEYKLTLKDKYINIIENGNVTRTGNVVTVPYKITNSNTSNSSGSKVTQISLMILDKEFKSGNSNDARILCYKTISKATTETSIANEGTVSFILPKDIAQKICGEGYYAYILAESLNEGNKTDYANISSSINIPHGHYFSYAAGTGENTNSVIATCLNKGCSLPDSKSALTIKAPAHDTSGDEKTAVAVLSGLDAFNEATKLNISSNDISYSGREGTTYNIASVPPEALGKYRAEITVENITVGVDYEIKQREVTVSGIKVKDRAYNGTKEAELDYSNAVLTGVLDADKAKIGISASGEFTDANAGKNKTVNISNLVLTDKVSSGSGSVIGNYILSATNQQTEASAEIFKADSKISEKPTAKTGLVYTGDNLELVTKGTAENGTLVYALTETGASAPTDDKYSADIPTAVNAGEYIVYYKVIGDTNYNDVAVANIDVKVKKASQKAPQLTSTDETVSGKSDGTITGLSTAMEISTEGADKGFSAVTDISGNGFAPGTYFVRYAEDKNHEASASVTIAIKAGANEPKPDPKPQPDPVIPTPVVTSVPEEPDTGSKTVTNKDGSTTTTTKTKNEDGTITESTVREWKNGDKNITEIIKDADGNILSTLTGTVRISKKGTKTEKTDIQKADGYHSSSSVKTYKSGKEVSSSSTTFANGSKQAYTETKNADGTLTRKVMDTNAKGKSTLTVTTVVWGEDDSDTSGTDSSNNGNDGTTSPDGDKTSSNSGDSTNNRKLVKTVMKYKVTGDGKIRLTSLKTDGDTAIIPKTVTFDGEKNMRVSLGKGLFKGMAGIKEIYIYAENLKKIYAGAFNDVPADAKFYIKASATNCKKIARMIQKSGFGKVDYTKI